MRKSKGLWVQVPKRARCAGCGERIPSGSSAFCYREYSKRRRGSRYYGARCGCGEQEARAYESVMRAYAEIAERRVAEAIEEELTH